MPGLSGTRVLVVGVGGIGGSIAGLLSDGVHEGLELQALTTNPDVIESVRSRGFALRGLHGQREVAGSIHDRLDPDTSPFDFVLLATRPPQVEEAAAAALPFLKEGGALVCLQNGLCEDRVARIAGPERVLGAVVAWGAGMPEPGVFERTSSGGFVIGRMDGQPDDRLEPLALLLEPIGPVTASENLQGARWSKLALNSAVSTLGTLGRNRLGVLLRNRGVRRLALELMSEVVYVARAEGVRLEKVAGTMDLEWLALTEAERQGRSGAGLVAKHSLLLAVGTRYRRLRSSMLRAIERGRSPSIEFLNGEVVQRGHALGIPTPANQRAVELVGGMVDGTVPGGMETLADFARDLGL